MDLAATDILRSRELGVPRYNEFRRLLQPEPPSRFEDADRRTRSGRTSCARVYNDDIEKVDLTVGMFAEPLPRGLRVQRHGVPDLHRDGLAAAEQRPLLHARLHARGLHAGRHAMDRRHDMSACSCATAPSFGPRCSGSRRVRAVQPGDGMSSAIAPRLHAALVAGVIAARYLDRYYRDGFDRVVRPAVVELVQAVIRHRLPQQPAVLAEERELEGEAAATQAIIDTMATFARRTYSHATSERIGNTKTYGVVRGEFVVAGDLPERLRHGVFAEARTFPAWVRFGGPGPLAPPDPRDNGILSVGRQADGRPRAEAAGRRAAHAGLHRHQLADLHDA